MFSTSRGAKVSSKLNIKHGKSTQTLFANVMFKFELISDKNSNLSTTQTTLVICELLICKYS